MFWGNFPFEAQAPTQWQDAQAPSHASSYAKQLNTDTQARRPPLEGVPGDGFKGFLRADQPYFT